MLITTLCYIEHRDHYLMLHRTKKAHDINEGKWIGVGGKFADRESPEECLLREVREETGYRLTSWRFRGFITFLQENYETEYMCLYTADGFEVPPQAKAGFPASGPQVGSDGGPAAGDDRPGSRPADGGEPADRGVPADNEALPASGDDPSFASDDPADWPVPDCDEGVLRWIPKARVGDLNLWPGDRIFLRLLDQQEDFFSLKLVYSGDDLLEAVLDGAPLDLS